MQLTLQSSLWDQEEAKLLLKPHLCLASSPAPSLPYRFLPSASQQDICVRITFTGTAPRISMSDVTLKGYSRSIALIMPCIASVQFSSVQFSGSVVVDSATPWTAAHQVSLSITNSRSLLKLMSIKSVMPSNHLILILLPLIS